MGVHPLTFGNIYTYAAKMLPQIKWSILNDADINQLPFVPKKWTFKWDYREFGGQGVTMLPIFLGGSIKLIILRKQKKYAPNALGRQILCCLSNFNGFWSKFSQFSLVTKCAEKEDFQETSKGPQSLMRG